MLENRLSLQGPGELELGPAADWTLVTGNRSDGTSNLVEQDYARFREGLHKGTLKPGQRLVEASVAAALGMSRTPVREAMRRLQTEGLIVHSPPRGLCVASPDPDQVDELYLMREALEGAAARMAAQRANAAEITFLQQLVTDENLLIDKPEEMALHNAKLHRAIYRAAHNRYLLQTARNMTDSMILLGPCTLEAPGRAAPAHVEHATLVAAIAARDAAAAEAAAQLHIRNAQQTRLQMIMTGAL